MSNNSFDSSVTLRNIDIQNTMAQIAAENLLQFYSHDQLMADYDHLFSEYIENIYLSDIDNYFVPMLQTANSSDIDVFFIKCSVYMKESKGHKPILLTGLYDATVSRIGNYLNENGLHFSESEFLKALNVFIFDFLVIDLSGYFTGLKTRVDQGLLSTQPAIVTTSKKLKTNLSVPELVLLFRSLDELKPDVFDVESKEELFAFIAANFETKASSSLSAQSVKNNFYKYNEKAKGKWTEHFSTLRAFVFGLKEI
jgi:hypothetical protein